MRIAVVGLGSIARKAYLPVLAARDDVELVFCTRNPTTLRTLSQTYRIRESVGAVAELPGMRVDAAFVHTSTESHVQVAEQLLAAGIHVYVDKPIAYSLAECRRAVDAADRAGRILMIGFNRRFAPSYRALHAIPDRRLIFLEKHRVALPDHPRRVIFDDFIHVVDTLRFLSPGPILRARVSAFQLEGRLHHVTLQLVGAEFTAIGVMNRDSGATEETLELMSPGNKWSVRGLDTTVHCAGGEERTYRFDDWTTVLHRRGFPQIVDHFLSCVRSDRAPRASAHDALRTHELCEWILTSLEGSGGLDESPPYPPDPL